ncbi:MAG: hypothetical protein ACJ79R_19890 [Anaeromyxobacteraceae bacterium]
MTKSACAAVGLTASILMVGCAGNASSRGSDGSAGASGSQGASASQGATGSQSAANAPGADTSNADASKASNKSTATNSDANANASASAAPAANAPAASAASQGTGSSAQAKAQPNEKRGEFQGRIERLDRADNVTIAGSESVGLAFEEFKLDDKTQVTTPNGKGSLAELNEGDEVRASFSGSGEELHVDKLQVVTPKAAAADSSR